MMEEEREERGKGKREEHDAVKIRKLKGNMSRKKEIGYFKFPLFKNCKLCIGKASDFRKKEKIKPIRTTIIPFPQKDGQENGSLIQRMPT